MSGAVPIIDLAPWFAGGDGRAEVAAQVDEALRTAGFLLITGHGVPDELRAEVRALAHEFFALPPEGSKSRIFGCFPGRVATARKRAGSPAVLSTSDAKVCWTKPLRGKPECIASSVCQDNCRRADIGE